MTAPTRSGGRTTSQAAQPKPQAEFEVGVPSFLPWQTPYKNAWEVLRDEADVGVRELVAMRRTDGQARALYRLITLPIRAALKTATFVPEEGVDGGDDEAQFIQDMLTLPVTGGGMQVPFGRFMAQLVMAIFDGFEAFEMVYWQPKTGPLKNKWTLKKLAHRPSEQLTFILDRNSEFKGLRQRTMYQDQYVDVVIPGENILYYTANAEERPFYGISYFNAAYKHWEAKFKLYVVAHIAAQRAAVGTRVGTIPPNPSREEKTAFQRALSDVGIAQWMTMPEGYKVESLKEAGGFDFLAYINHHNSQMSKSVLAAFFDDSQGTGGDASLIDFGRQSDALFLLMLQTIMGEIEEVINNQLIPRFIDWNFNSGKYPLFRFGQLTEEQKGALLDVFKALAVVAPDASNVVPEMWKEIEKQIAEEFGLEIDWEAVEQREAEEQAQAEAMMQQQQMNDGSNAPTAPDVAAPAVGGDVATLPVHGAQISPQNVPDGFTLTNRDGFNLTLNQLALDLLDDAAAHLTRGKTNSGGPKYVRSLEGAKTYGVPVGSPITRDMDKKLGQHGQKGEKFGRDHSHNPDPTQRHDVARTGKQAQAGGGKGDTKNVKDNQQLGGGKGDTTGEHGNVNPGVQDQQTKPQRVLTNPKEPGAQLIDYGDGTVAIRDANGKMTPRQVFDIAQFEKYGWKVDKSLSPTPQAETDKAKAVSAKTDQNKTSAAAVSKKST
jgi:phage gp29-like protein